jgi:hypothetical protein
MMELYPAGCSTQQNADYTLEFIGEGWTEEQKSKIRLEHRDPSQTDHQWWQELFGLCPTLAVHVRHREEGLPIYHPLIHMPQGAGSHSPVYIAQCYERKKKIGDDFLEQKKWSSYLFLIEKPYRAAALSRIQDRMTDAEYWENVSWVWTSSESNRMDNRIWKRLLSSARPEQRSMMCEQEQKVFDALPDRITIYRGFKKRRTSTSVLGSSLGRSLPSNRKGFSWTLSKEKAIWFSNIVFGIGIDEKKPHMVRTLEVSKSEVLAYLDSREEQEILLRTAT